ncbi:DEAD/DEAH box helicase [Nocardiopsis tropica]|uniref:DEAD/DEAH box helicase n=1 Tax=Nocardiopsis tropica TaxID=109330 RepID=A0ABU7KQD2_9ACTN|nr:DEAD/DEAH box helicase [Nocardiopsis umidischolae]MEE2051498.1 DEAD/DEAH box helicase [Nocardiopsis umidischolae]
MPTLAIRLSPSGTTVVLEADASHTADLSRLAHRFRGSAYQSPEIVHVPLDNFLSSVQSLRIWPSKDVRWDTAVVNLVRDSAHEAKEARARLSDDTPVPAEVSADDVEGLLDPGWLAPLTAFQRRDIGRLLSMRHGANFSVPGAGKTRVALADFHASRNRGEVLRMLVVAPKSAHGSWTEEVELCFEKPPAVHIADGGMLDPLAEMVVINYERLAGSQDALAKWLSAEPSMLVLDEAHRMKRGAQGVYGAVCLALGPLARRRLALSGTPAPNGAKDLQSLFSFVWPGQGGRTVERAIADRSLRDASAILKPFFCRTTKQELGLPPLDPRVVRVRLDDWHRELYSAIAGEEGLRAAGSGQGSEGLEKYGRVSMYLIMAAASPALLSEGGSKYEPLPYDLPRLEVPQNPTLRQMMDNLPRYEDSPKYKEACKIVRANAARGRKTIVWSTFVRSLTTLEKMLADCAPAVVHGGTADRDEQIDRFRKDPGCLVLLSNPATLGEGISLHQVCHEAVYVDRDFTAGRFLQSLDRIHRLGLAPGTETNVRILIAEKTIDEVIEERLAAKLRFMGAVLDDPGVEQLADLADEPAAPAGLERSDLETLMRHLHGDPRQ